MIKARIKIGDGAILDTVTAWGLIPIDADERTAPPKKKHDVTTYAEEAGEHLDPRTVDDAFDYKAKFLIEAPNQNLTNVNAKIATFNAALSETIPDTDIKKFKEVELYYDLNRVKIVGIPDPIAVPTEVYHSPSAGTMDFAICELTIRVANPKKCNFNTTL